MALSVYEGLEDKTRVVLEKSKRQKEGGMACKKTYC